MADLPTGTVTLLFTDIEGSTRLLQELGRERYVEALTAHRRIIRDVLCRRDGFEVEMQGDSFHFAFASAHAAVAGAAEVQEALAAYGWPSQPIRIRIGLHTGEPLVSDGLYAGLDVHRAARIMGTAHGGQVLLSERTGDLVTGDSSAPPLLRDLGRHRLKDLLEPERLYQLGEGDFPPLRTLNQTNLPVASNPLIGRDRELLEVNELFEHGARAVTITGPGGSGKTRLALQVAAELIDEFKDGVFWVPLAAVSDTQLVLPAIAQRVGTIEQPASYLSGRETLLLLDNFEHLARAAGSVAELLAAAPGLRLLVTSRSPLHIEAEHEYPLDPLSNHGAVELFLERARQSGTRVEASATVEAICTRLDNLPLAVELAAGRVKLLGGDALLTRLEQRLPLLTGGRRDLPERQRTLRATIEWSYELLNEDARTLFARLSVFAGGFSLDAAEAICEADLDSLADLAAISLLKPTGEGRFLMLETIREYAMERLDGLGEPEQLRTRHAKWFLELAGDAATRYYTSDQVELFEQLEQDHGNFRAALDWFREQHSLDLELELAATLHDFWIARGYVSEGRARLEPALSKAEAADVPDSLRAKALDAAAWLAGHQLDYDAAEALVRESLALARALNDDRQIVSALANLGAIEVRRGRNASGRDMFEEALSRARGNSDDVWTMHMLGNLADLALYEGEFVQAGTLAQESLELAQAAGDTWTMTVSLLNLGSAAMHQGDAARASRSFERALELAREVGARYCVGAALEGIAALTAASHPHDAARLIGASDEAFRSTGSELPPFEQGVHDRTVELLEERIGQAECERLVTEGSEAALEEAVALALDRCRSGDTYGKNVW